MPVPVGTLGYGQLSGWSVALGDIMVVGGDVEEIGLIDCPLPVVRGCLTLPPDGLGVPALRTQDISYLGRDGVKHHEDWYEPRIITLQVTIGQDGCGCDPETSVRGVVSDLLQEWRRSCGTERELVLYPPNCSCDDFSAATSDLDRPLSVLGRPRQASVVYTRNGTADITLRFDASDHLLYLLDCCGTPGSNVKTVALTANLDVHCRSYDRGYDSCANGWTYDVDLSTVGGPVLFFGGGTEIVHPVVTLYGPLTNPTIESLLTGEAVSYQGSVLAGSSVDIDLGQGTATENSADRTGWLDGDLVMSIRPDDNEWRLQAYSAGSSGYAEVNWRPAVIVA